MKDIVCKHCATVNDYSTEEKTFSNGTTHIQANCNNCGKYIQYLPQHKEAILYFGKYKGKEVKDVDDKGYLEWLIEKKVVHGSVKVAVDKQIEKL